MSALDQLNNKHEKSQKQIGFPNNYWDDRMEKLEPMRSLVSLSIDQQDPVA